MLYADFFYYYARSKWYGGKLGPHFCWFRAFFHVFGLSRWHEGRKRSWFHSTRPRLVLPVATWVVWGESETSDPCNPSWRIQSLAVWLFRYDQAPQKFQRSPWVSGQPNAAKLANANGNFWNAKSNGIWIHRGWMRRKGAEIEWRELRQPCGSHVSRLVVNICCFGYCYWIAPPS